MTEFDQEYSLPDDEGGEGLAVGKGASGGSPCGAAPSPVSGMRVALISSFDPAVSLSGADRDAYARRFVTLFVSTAGEKHGGMGRVLKARNTQGELFAVKLLNLPDRDEDESEEAHVRRVEGLRAAFQHEYDCHRRLSGMKGFPRLYGRGELDGVPVLIMEWVEGVTLARAARSLAVDDAGRLSPLVAARISRDLFDLVARMDLMDSGFAHRDISPRNVMVRTSRQSLAEQVDEGAFDLYLIDFGSAARLSTRNTSFTSQNGVFRGATADYAPPEMLSDDLPELDQLRQSSAIDVYAAASVAYRLAAGRVPFDLHASTGGVEPAAAQSPYRVKSASEPDLPQMAHAGEEAIESVLLREPEVAVAVDQACSKLDDPAESEDVRAALSQVDELFAQVIMDCLARRQADRPDAAAVRDALGAFARRYAENVERALLGNPLIPCVPGELTGAGASDELSPLTIARLVCKMVSGVAVIAIAVSAGVFANDAAFNAASAVFTGSGRLPGVLAAIALMLPEALGAAAALLAGRRGKGAAFACGTAVLAIAAICVRMGFSALNLDADIAGFVERALLACAATGWFGLVADFCFRPASGRPAKGRQTRRTALAGASQSRGSLHSATAGQLEGAGLNKSSITSEDSHENPVKSCADYEINPDDDEQERC